MKIYLHRNGKNYGPYSLSVIRDFLKSGKCQENELVCCDGKNWIKLRELPGLAESPSITESKEVRAKMPESEARPKPAKRKTLLLGATSFLCVLAGVSAFLFPGEENEEQVHSEDASQGSASPGAGAKPNKRIQQGIKNADINKENGVVRARGLHALGVNM